MWLPVPTDTNLPSTLYLIQPSLHLHLHTNHIRKVGRRPSHLLSTASPLPILRLMYLLPHLPPHYSLPSLPPRPDRLLLCITPPTYQGHLFHLPLPFSSSSQWSEPTPLFWTPGPQIYSSKEC